MRDLELSRSPVSWSEGTRSNELRTSVLKDEGVIPAENSCLYQRWNDCIKGGMEQPHGSAQASPSQNNSEVAATETELEPTSRETSLHIFEKLTSPVRNIKKGIKRKTMTSNLNLMQDDDERPTKLQAALKEVPGNCKLQSISKREKEIAPTIAGTTTNCSTTLTTPPTVSLNVKGSDLLPSTADAERQRSTEKMEIDYQESNMQKLENLPTRAHNTPAANSVAKLDGNPQTTKINLVVTPSWIYNLGEIEFRRGLTNLGNSCWLNSLQQCLIRCQGFLETFLRPREGKPLSSLGASIHCFIKKMTETYPSDIEEVFNPWALYTALAKIPNWEVLRLRRQQDPTEMLQWMLQYLALYPQFKSKDEKCTLGHNDTVLKEVSDLFKGVMRQSIYCTECEITTFKEDPFFILTLSLDSPKSASTTSIEELLQRSAYPEFLEDENKFACTNCMEKVLAGKSHTISTPPKLLLLHIKRFSKVKGCAAKRTDHVKIERVLQLEKTSLMKTAAPRYLLKGVIVHSGEYSPSDSTSGHYTANVLHGDGWLKCSDKEVIKTEWDTVKETQAYLLFYEQVDPTSSLLPPQKKRKKLIQNLPEITRIKDSNPQKPQNWAAEEKVKSGKKTDEERDVERKKETYEDTALKEMLQRLLSRVDKLEDQVKKLQDSNLNLKMEVTAIKRKAGIDDEEVRAWINGEDELMRAVERHSPTPVIESADDEIDHRGEGKRERGYRENRGGPEMEARRRYSADHNPNKRKRRLTESQEMVEENEVSSKRRRDLNRPKKYEDDSRMEIDKKLKSSRNNQKHQNHGERQYDEQSKIWWEHRDYLRQCYKKHIDLPLDKKQDISIYSFTDQKVARGYQKVVTTRQGMYYELTDEQVEWNTVPRRSLTIGGDTCWRGQGVTVYKPHSERNTRPIVRHRFAINLSYVPRARFRTDRYYIHVYQTKVGPGRWTLRSKEMVRELQRKFKTTYWPRIVDTHGSWQGRTTTNRRKSEKVSNNRITEDRRRPAWTRNTWSDERSRGRLQRDTKNPQMQEVLAGLQRLSAAVEKMVDGGGRL